MKNLPVTISSFVLLFFCLNNLTAQIKTPNDDQLYKKRLVKAMDLREKQNQSFFAHKAEFSSLLLDYVISGKLTAYTNESFSSELNSEDFKKKLIIGNLVNWADTLDMDEYEIEEFKDQFSQPEYYSGRDLYQLEFTQDWIINNKKKCLSKRYYIYHIIYPCGSSR